MLPTATAFARYARWAFCCLLLVAPLQTSSESRDIVVHCSGDGVPLFLIGGGPAFTTWHLTPLQRQLEQRFRVCRWDMRGVGDNAGLPIEPSCPALAQWLDDMESVLPDRPSILWGHSWGALQALLFAKRHPERVAGLVLSNPVDPALKSLEHIEAKRHVHDIAEARLDIDDIGTVAEQRHGFRSKIASYFLDGQTGWEYSAAFTAADTNNALNVRIWEDYRRKPLTSTDLAALAAKVMGVIQCRHDVLMPETRQEYARLLPATRQDVIRDCSHFPWVETPQTYYRLLAETLDRAP